MTPEGRIKAAVNKALAQFGSRCYRFCPVQHGLGASTLDYLICVDGFFIAIETKAPGKKLTLRQNIVAAHIEQAGGMVYVVDSVDDAKELPSNIEAYIRDRNSGFNTKQGPSCA